MSASGHKPFPGRHLFQKSILYSSAGHSHRAFHNNNIFFLRPEILLLVRLRRITFLCGHEPGSQLYPRSPGTGSAPDLSGHKYLLLQSVEFPVLLPAGSLP